jgi:hypothetical protein
MKFRDSNITSDDAAAIIRRIIDEDIREEAELCEIISRREGLELTLGEAEILMEQAEEKLEEEAEE